MVKQSVLSVAVVLSVLIAGCLDKQNHSQSSSNSKVTEALGASISAVLGDSMSNSESAVPSQGNSDYEQSVAQTKDPDDQITTSRQTAITKAVKKVSPAVVSITVTEMVQGGRRLEFSEYYNRFVPVPIEREVSSMGSGFIISSDGLVVTNQHVANEQAKRVEQEDEVYRSAEFGVAFDPQFVQCVHHSLGIDIGRLKIGIAVQGAGDRLEKPRENDIR